MHETENSKTLKENSTNPEDISVKSLLALTDEMLLEIDSRISDLNVQIRLLGVEMISESNEPDPLTRCEGKN